MSTITALTIDTNGTVTMLAVEPTLEAIRDVVGAKYIEIVRSELGLLYIDEEGKYNSPEVNELATRIATIDRRDWIAGRAVLVGHDEDKDEAADITIKALTTVLGLRD